MGDEPAGPNTAEPRATKRSSDVGSMTSFRRTPPPQVQMSARGEEQATPSSASASKPAREAAESEDVEGVARRQREAAGQVDREAAVERRELGDRQRPVLSRDVAGKVQAEHAGGGLREIAGDGFGRARAAAGPCWSRSPCRRRRRYRRRAPYCRRRRSGSPLPIVIVPPVQLPKVLPVPPVTVTLA